MGVEGFKSFGLVLGHSQKVGAQHLGARSQGLEARV